MKKKCDKRHIESIKNRDIKDVFEFYKELFS